jgi:hypothetical protein
MQLILKLEQLALFALALYLFQPLGYAWWGFALLFLAPDLGMLGYLAGPRPGAIAYNLAHHQGLAILLYLAGAAAASPLLQFAGLLLLAHSSFDRILGYGLKHADSFKHTHLGWIGKAQN